MTIEEFNEDIKRFAVIGKLFYKYKHKQILREKLILNHLVILRNVFGVENSTRMLFLRLCPDYHAYLKTFLVYMGGLPDNVDGIQTTQLEIDANILTALKQL